MSSRNHPETTTEEFTNYYHLLDTMKKDLMDSQSSVVINHRDDIILNIVAWQDEFSKTDLSTLSMDGINNLTTRYLNIDQFATRLLSPDIQITSLPSSVLHA